MFKNELNNIVKTKETSEHEKIEEKRQQSIKQAKSIVEEIRKKTAELVKNGNFQQKGDKRIAKINYKTYLGRYFVGTKSRFLSKTLIYRVEPEVYEYIEKSLLADGFQKINYGFMEGTGATCVKCKSLLEFESTYSESYVYLYVDCYIEF